VNFLSKEQIRFLQCLLRNKVKFIVVGGIASIFYGVRRNTADLDVFIQPTVENGQRLLKALKQLNLKLPEISNSEFEKELILSFGFEPDAIDIINHAPGIEFENAYQNARTIMVSGINIKMIDIYDLIKNKESMKRKGEKALLDEFDVKSLRKILRKKSKDGP